MTAEKTFQGAWRISDIIGNRLVSIQYFGMTKREALRAFRKDSRDE